MCSIAESHAAADLSLLEPSPALGSMLLELAAELRRTAEPFGRELSEITQDNIGESLLSLRHAAEGLDLPPGYVPMSTFLAISDGNLVGFVRLRHLLNDALVEYGGHIGFFVRPAARRRGIATRMLALTLKRARQLGLTRVLITCDSDNLPSRRVIERNGGLLESEEISRRSGVLVRRYWICL